MNTLRMAVPFPRPGGHVYVTPPPSPPRAISRALAAAVALLVFAAPAAAETPERGDFDARPAGDETGSSQAEALREQLGTFGLVSEEQRTGTARAVAKLDGFLTRPSDRAGRAIALDYVRDNPKVFGLDGDDVAALRLADRTFTGGVEYLRWQQRYRGIPSSDTQLDAAVTGAGRLLSVTGPAAPDLAVDSIVPALSAEQAYAAVRRSGRAAAPRVAVRNAAGGAERTTTFADGGTASLVLYQGGDGARLAWRVLAPVSPTEVYDATVDAGSGAVVRRANRVRFADALIYPTSPRAPAEQVAIDDWLDDPTRLKGPRVHAFVDAQDRVKAGQLTVHPDDEVGPIGGHWMFTLNSFPSPRCEVVNCTWDPLTAGSWAGNADQSATQLFALANTFLDHLRSDGAIDFNDDEGYHGDDPILAQAMDGANGPGGIPDAQHVNNAGFLALPNGTPGHLLSFLFSHGANPRYGDLDAANDASVIYHEVAHGLSERLVVDGQDFGALTSAQAGAIGEGTSDYYALDFLVGDADRDDDSLAEHRVGSYLDDDDPRGLRYQAIDCDTGSTGNLCQAAAGTDAGGFTYEDFGDVNGQAEIHSDGEIWAQTLWDIRQVLGPAAARRVITGGLRIAPAEPSFLDMRNAILASAIAHQDPMVDEKHKVWDVFAARGMGYFASTTGGNDVAPVADFETEPDEGTVVLSGAVHDEEGNVVKDAEVGIAGHDTRLRGGQVGPRLASAVDDNTGAYEIEAPAGTYPLVVARALGFRDDARSDFTLPEEGATEHFTLERDWSTGATVERFTGHNNTSSGCGPGGLIDNSSATVWGTERVAGGQKIVIDLGAPIDITSVWIDPGAGCGDDATAALKGFALSASTAPDAEFSSLRAGAFAPGDAGKLVQAWSGSRTAVRYIELHAQTPQSTAGSGKDYIDVAEIHVGKAIGAPRGPTTESAAAELVSTKTARVRGTVNPNQRGAVTTAFQYGTSPQSLSSIPAAGVANGQAQVPVARDLSGLQPDTTYYYRFVAYLGGVAYPGRFLTFKTAPAVAPTPTPTPTVTPTPTPDPPDPGPAVTTAFVSERLSADRRGMFKVKWTFGDAAPAGKATVRVVGKRRKRIASARIAVQPGRTITKTLRLNRAGRRMIRRGKSSRVTLELVLPSGGTLRERVRLSRRR
jgi:hypothetical protein